MELHILAGLPIGLREMLEALLVTLLVVGILKKEKILDTRKDYLRQGNSKAFAFFHSRTFFILSLFIFSFIVSAASGYGIFVLFNFIASELKNDVKIIEAILAIVLVPFLIHFLFHIMKMKRKELKISKKAKALVWYSIIIFLALFRESFEVSFIFFGRSLANSSEQNLFEGYGILIGGALAIVIILVLNFGIMKINLKWILNITAMYLLIQVAYIIGYAFHEVSEYIVKENISSNEMFLPAYNLRNTVASKNEPLGIILNVMFGYYDKPEGIMLTVQFLSLALLSPLLFVFSKRERMNLCKDKINTLLNIKFTPKRTLRK